ncbi:MAG: AAA family ATPase, partial [Planctomycetota bacterium]
MERVIVVGSSGSGKTTFARRLGAILGAPHVESDALYWGPNWTPRDDDELRRLVAEAAAGDRWVFDGNYWRVRDLVWTRATDVVWLNPSLPRCFGRGLKRSVMRLIRREELWAGNRESFRETFLSRKSVLWELVEGFGGMRRRYRAVFDAAEFPAGEHGFEQV